MNQGPFRRLVPTLTLPGAAWEWRGKQRCSRPAIQWGAKQRFERLL